MIRFTSKNEFYQSPDRTKGLYRNAFVEPTEASIDTANKRLTVHFHLCHVNGENKTVVERNALPFTEVHIPTIITNDKGDPQEVISYLMGGGTYSKDKIVDWGYPSFSRVQAYFKLESIWTGLEFADSPFIQLAIDWLSHVLKVEGQAAILNFDYNPTKP